MFDVISIFLNLFKLVLWPNMCYMLENVTCTLEKNASSALNIIKISNVSFKATVVSLLIFYKKDLSLYINGLSVYLTSHDQASSHGEERMLGSIPVVTLFLWCW